MEIDKGLPAGSLELRCLAEERLRTDSNVDEPSLPNEESQRLIHELHVHQIELEMQNDELRQARDERQKMEALLGKYSDLYDFAPVGYFNLDQIGIIRAVNLTGTGFLGVERSLLINRSFDLFISDETRPVFHDFLDRVFASETRETCEVVFQHKGRSPLFVQVEAVLSDSREECRAVVIDITERKRSEETQARLAALVESSDDAIIAKTLNGNILSWNPGSERLFGYQVDEVLGKPINLIIPPELLEEEEKILLRLAAGERIEHFDTVRMDKYGRRVDVSVTASPIIDTQGRIIGASKIVRDITRRKLVEEAQRRAKEEWERTFDSVPDLIAVLDNQCRVLRVNDAMARRLGFKPEDCVGLHCYEAFHGTSGPPEFCPHARTIKDDCQHIEELYVDRFGGDFLVTTTPLLDEKREYIGSVHIAHDITVTWSSINGQTAKPLFSDSAFPQILWG